MRNVLLLVSLVLALAIPWWHDLLGCAPAPHKGETVAIYAEEAIIVYDAATRTEHFIRRADFRTQAKDFGFLVPTPTKPELGETSSDVFRKLASVTRPRLEFSGRVNRIVVKGDRTPTPTGAPERDKRAPEILDRKQVAGYDAVVLRAEDEEGLKKWLEDNKYDARPALMDWLKKYVQNKWIITAFKVSSDGTESRRWNTSVRMSFQTDAPFYPYREPADLQTQQGSRSLRIYFLADARYQGTLGRAGYWPARTAWANACSEETVSRVVTDKAVTQNAKGWHLTEFEDHSSPRPGTDEVYFSRAADQSIVERIQYYDRTEYVSEDNVKSATNTRKNDVKSDGNIGEDEVKSNGYRIWYIISIATFLAVVAVLALVYWRILRNRNRIS